MNTNTVTLFPEVEHKHLTNVAVLAMHAVTSLLYFPMIYASQYKYTSMAGKIAHIQIIPQQSAQNTANLLLQTYEKNQRTYFIV